MRQVDDDILVLRRQRHNDRGQYIRIHLHLRTKSDIQKGKPVVDRLYSFADKLLGVHAVVLLLRKGRRNLFFEYIKYGIPLVREVKDYRFAAPGTRTSKEGCEQRFARIAIRTVYCENSASVVRIFSANIVYFETHLPDGAKVSPHCLERYKKKSVHLLDIEKQQLRINQRPDVSAC